MTYPKLSAEVDAVPHKSKVLSSYSASSGCSATSAPVNLAECKKFSTDWGSKKQFGFVSTSGPLPQYERLSFRRDNSNADATQAASLHV